MISQTTFGCVTENHMESDLGRANEHFERDTRQLGQHFRGFALRRLHAEFKATVLRLRNAQEHRRFTLTEAARRAPRLQVGIATGFESLHMSVTRIMPRILSQRQVLFHIYFHF